MYICICIYIYTYIHIGTCAFEEKPFALLLISWQMKPFETFTFYILKYSNIEK